MDLIYITNDLDQARVVQAAGVDRIMVDLELNGKVQRQGHLNTVISRHNFSDIRSLRRVLSKSELMVRVNPIFSGSREEIEHCIALGADRIMLPMFTTAHEVRVFLDIIDGRVGTTLLLETPAALARISEILEENDVEEVHIGLNDLHLGFGLNFMFELLSGGIIDYCAGRLKSATVKFGIGGISILGQGMLPAQYILAEHFRLGSSQVILSRDYRKFFDSYESFDQSKVDFQNAVTDIRRNCISLRDYSVTQFDANRKIVQNRVAEIVRLRAQSSDLQERKAV